MADERMDDFLEFLNSHKSMPEDFIKALMEDGDGRDDGGEVTEDMVDGAARKAGMTLGRAYLSCLSGLEEVGVPEKEATMIALWTVHGSIN